MKAQICSADGCFKPNNSGGLCGMHGQRMRRHGSLNPVGMSPRCLPTEERFWHYVEVTGFCWLWTGTTCVKGYGRFSADSASWQAHRFAWTLLMGDIPAGLEIDHLCRIRNCVNPDHLEPVDHRTNVLRSPSNPIALASFRATCTKGHPLRHVPGARQRRCFTCNPRRRSVRDRFLALVELRGGFAVWTGEIGDKGGPLFFNGTRRVSAGRFAHELFIGQIPPDATVTRVCGERLCMLPDHLVAAVDPRWRARQLVSA